MIDGLTSAFLCPFIKWPMLRIGIFPTHIQTNTTMHIKKVYSNPNINPEAWSLIGHADLKHIWYTTESLKHFLFEHMHACINVYFVLVTCLCTLLLVCVYRMGQCRGSISPQESIMYFSHYLHFVCVCVLVYTYICMCVYVCELKRLSSLSYSNFTRCWCQNMQLSLQSCRDGINYCITVLNAKCLCLTTFMPNNL